MYIFNKNLDAIGLPMESSFYIKKNCKHCLGRGFNTHLIGDGYKIDSDNKKVKNDVRTYSPCVCVNRGYVRIRVMLEENADKISQENGTNRNEIVKNIVNEFVSVNPSLF